MSDKSTAVSSGISLGSAIAVAISWSINQSILWAILHGVQLAREGGIFKLKIHSDKEEAILLTVDGCEEEHGCF